VGGYQIFGGTYTVSIFCVAKVGSQVRKGEMRETGYRGQEWPIRVRHEEEQVGSQRIEWEGIDPKKEIISGQEDGTGSTKGLL
jgi:hypothetical protein